MSKEEVIMKVLTASPEALARITAALEGREQSTAVNVRLFGFGAAAREAGVSRATVYRMVKAGTLRTVELRPGCRRVPASELVRIAKGGAVNE